MTKALMLTDANSWAVSGVRDAEGFFSAVQPLVAGATHVFLEGSPAQDVAALLRAHIDPSDYLAPVGTLWSWPARERRMSLKASAALFSELSAAAAHHAELEICTHIHVYRNGEALLQWFDAFIDPVLISRIISIEVVEQFCASVGGVLTKPSL